MVLQDYRELNLGLEAFVLKTATWQNKNSPEYFFRIIFLSNIYDAGILRLKAFNYFSV